MDSRAVRGQNAHVPPSTTRRPSLRSIPAAACALALAAVLLGVGQLQPADPPPAPVDEPSPPLAPDEVIIELIDGRQVTGLLVGETAEALVIRVEGIESRIPRLDIARLDLLPPVLDRYRAMRAAIRDDDAARRLDLAEWLRARDEFGMALFEVEGVLDREPVNGRARRMARLLEQLILLRAKAPTDDSQSPGTTRDDPTAAAAPTRDQPGIPLLTEDQLNLIKVYELDLEDPPRLLIPREFIDELLERYKVHDLIPLSREGRRALYDAPPAEIVNLLFQLRARELYPRVRVLGQPEAMSLFRDTVHRTWLMNSCATSRCHGGAEAGRLQLATERTNADRTVYTNFLILERFRVPDPEGAAPEGVPLINYDNPSRSPLLQMGLPGEISLYPHPSLIGRDAQRFRPVFRSTTDAPFRDAVAWLESMYRPRPDYPVNYELPGASEPVTPEPIAR